ncbi:MFS general substrate transporter [Rhizodiscina lignyota]|uniref:MFS general substrate transporter n=1 Tax=Rhizodiscina lignyota TaxID=1504668 RepID=A0A9P4I8Q5_9PEZI|nr:MFS general substrate transporter [Rhizodiscina lignyota]
MPPFRFPFTATRWQVVTYLLGVALFSISFLVFLNSSISFVITERIGQRSRVGDAVGTLGFADEALALLACPLWGMLSDRVGVRAVAVAGYLIVGVALAGLVMSKNVYPDLLLGRLAFSLGGAATATMVTAILPSMTLPVQGSRIESRPLSSQANGHNVTPSISSELTITPTRYQSSSSRQESRDGPIGETTDASTSQLAGLVGMFTGLGALLALVVFLPLPARFQKRGATSGEAVADSFFIVGAVAIVVSLFCFVGLRNLPGEEHKGWSALFGKMKEGNKYDGLPSSSENAEDEQLQLSYLHLLGTSVRLGVQDTNIGLGYLGGFVARASSVAISLFIPLFVNAYFISSGICNPDPNTPGMPADPGEVKRRCAQAYVVAAKLTGTSQLVALICAPIFGYLSGRYTRFNVPLLLAAFAGIAGYTAFGLLKSPDPSSEDGTAGVYFIVALLGISQIGAIVCSLGLLGRGIQGGDAALDRAMQSNGTPITSPSLAPSSRRDSVAAGANIASTVLNESSPLIPSHIRRIQLSPHSSRARLKGSIAGIYSLGGGAGILLLTKAGGVMFDQVDVGAPFWLMAGFNGLLFIVGVVCSVIEWAKQKREENFISWQRDMERESTPVDAGGGG